MVVILQALGAVSIVSPRSSCYALNNSSHIFDFTSWIGHSFTYEEKNTDLVLEFCKDVENRSQTGYVAFGKFSLFNYFVAGSGNVDFVQEYHGGDLAKCETIYDKKGRSAQVNIICGSCLSGQCKGELGCICSVNYKSNCRVIIELSIPCEKSGPRVFEGFTVGFHPRSWEVVWNGMTQLGFEKSHHEFSFGTEQTRVSLYMTAISSLSTLVQKPIIKVFPKNGLVVKLSGSGITGKPPTTLSPTMLILDWRCEQARDYPYEVDFTVPVDGYEPIHFTLNKMCEYRQEKQGDAERGWAIFGVLSCIFMVLSMLFCCGGFIYRTQVEQQRGLDALPGMTLLSACLETVSGAPQGYARPEEGSSAFVNQASQDRQPMFGQSTWKSNERRYGSI